jgi:Flp pilus assembly protein TadD
LYFVRRRYEEAEAEILRAVELRPRDALNLTALGMVCGVQGRYAEAERLFLESLALAPGDLQTQKYLQAVRRAAATTPAVSADVRP